MTRDWLPPRVRPENETAGYLGYYTRTYLGEIFDLIDGDGCWPAIWIYWKQRTKVRRYFEEKPRGQELRDSQRRILRGLAAEGENCYVIWDAEKLADEPPDFPITITRLGAKPKNDRPKTFADRGEFDHWLMAGWAPLRKVLEMPYEPPDGWPPDLDYRAFDRAITKIAVALGDGAA